MKNLQLILVIFLSMLLFHCKNDVQPIEITPELNGKLTCLNNLALADVQVTLQNDDGIIYQTLTDANGDYSFESIDSGEYQLSFSNESTLTYNESNFAYYDDVAVLERELTTYELLANDLNADGNFDIFDLITFRIFYSGNEVDQLIQNWNFYANQEVEAGSINSIDSFMIDLDDNTTLDVHHIGVFKGDPQGQACN
jgi:hypothetical protein